MSQTKLQLQKEQITMGSNTNQAKKATLHIPSIDGAYNVIQKSYM
ncbi:hypothetical protein HanXRQr2_Chr03g0125411 [Helianthus annuus]|uniref:Uncharacterized protein n=1 Tax=Helianthus annuus TaxID=4232 RepID=A0A9K3JHQ2_HELAN|nr:hypothetical protein HanXRQr2_Chr03g0125411 [Helianthus annuus]KAJ0932210.1 hypothetical protein HanPSC8_Chr04g0171041 [Helianthus annuus]